MIVFFHTGNKSYALLMQLIMQLIKQFHSF